MALRNQPYIPLYVQDVLTDEKLIECSMQSHGLYFRLMCILHKQEKYGKIVLKQKYKQKKSKFENFADMLCRQMPFDRKEIINCLIELSEENVINISEDYLLQKRMVKDGEISEIRAEVGKTGGSSVTKQYGKSGYLYLMSNHTDLCKVGISVNPQNRLYRIRSDNKIKNFDIITSVEVSNMGVAEDLIQDHFKDIIDGEWIRHYSESIINRFNGFTKIIEAKIKANPQAKRQANSESEYEVEVLNIIDKDKKQIPDKDKKAIRERFLFFMSDYPLILSTPKPLKPQQYYNLVLEFGKDLVMDKIIAFESYEFKRDPKDSYGTMLRWCRKANNVR